MPRLESAGGSCRCGLADWPTGGAVKGQGREAPATASSCTIPGLQSGLRAMVISISTCESRITVL